MNLILVVPFALAAIAAASMGALFPTGDWYLGLQKPSWTPPNWLFPIAWTALYVVMVVAGYRAAVSGHSLAIAAVALWGLQITLNAIWTPVVFGAHRLDSGVVVILALWLAIAATTILLFSVDRLSGWLFVPYLAWVSYASALNIALWRLNP